MMWTVLVLALVAHCASGERRTLRSSSRLLSFVKFGKLPSLIRRNRRVEFHNLITSLLDQDSKQDRIKPSQSAIVPVFLDPKFRLSLVPRGLCV